jgi:hypothetical protein
MPGCGPSSDHAFSDRLAPESVIGMGRNPHYGEFLVEPLRMLGISIEIPMAGMRIGEQLHWFAERAQERP